MRLIYAFKNISITVLILIALLQSGELAYAGWQEKLSDAEIQAIQQTVTDQVIDNNIQNELPVIGAALGVEVLLIELQEIKSRAAKSPRIAEVFIYDYARQVASVNFVNVDTLDVVNTRVIKNIHLPLNEKEIDVAIRALTSDMNLLTQLSLEYENQFSKPLFSLEQVDMKVSIWNPGATKPSSHECQVTRCALVSLFTKNRYNFSVEPVVSLTAGHVLLNAVQ